MIKPTISEVQLLYARRADLVNMFWNLAWPSRDILEDKRLYVWTQFRHVPI